MKAYSHADAVGLSYITYASPVGMLTIISGQNAVKAILFGGPPAGLRRRRTELAGKTESELSEYFGGQRRSFSVPLAPEGTIFQKSVWQALTAIPYGETRSYKEIAEAAGSPKACRAVGMANNKNPIPIIIPCHRVIGADGSLVGYGGGLEIKKALLKLEGHEAKW
jgi:methylated-DNA-[protein]-cysteine S-methyltransferase